MENEQLTLLIAVAVLSFYVGRISKIILSINLIPATGLKPTNTIAYMQYDLLFQLT